MRGGPPKQRRGDGGENGGSKIPQVENHPTPVKLIDTILFFWRPAVTDRSFLHAKYVDENLSAKEVAQIAGCSKQTVLKNLRLHGITVRDPGQNIRPKAGAGLRFGQKVVRRKVVDYKREQEAITKMLDLHKQGLSYHQIAKIMDTWGEPTKTGKKGWDHQTVREIIMRDTQRRTAAIGTARHGGHEYIKSKG